MKALHDTITNMLSIPQLNNQLSQDQIQQLSHSHAHGGFAIHDLRETSHLIYLATMRTSVSLLSRFDPSIAADFNKFIALNDDPIDTQLQACHAKLHDLEPKFTYPLNSINPDTKAIHKLQHKYCFALQKKSHQLLLQSFLDQSHHTDPQTQLLGKINHIRLISLTEPGALAFLDAIPTIPQHAMSTIPFVIAVRRCLGMDLFPIITKNITCSCGKLISNPHVQTCTSAHEEVKTRHKSTQYLLQHALQRAHLPVSSEPHTNVGQCRFDIKTNNLDSPIGNLYLDVTLTSPFCIEHLHPDPPADYQPGQAMAAAAKFKISNYYKKHLATKGPHAFFRPVVFTSLGARDRNVTYIYSKLSSLPKTTYPTISTELLATSTHFTTKPPAAPFTKTQPPQSSTSSTRLLTPQAYLSWTTAIFHNSLFF
jgi:hypothetical protein